METAVTTTDWYQHLTEECKAIIVETTFTANWALIEGYWNLGKCIVENAHGYPLQDLVQQVAKTISKSPRTLYYATQLYQKYPRLDALPEGKNTSWKKVITDHLTDSTNHIRQEFTKQTQSVTCPKCGNVFDI